MWFSYDKQENRYKRGIYATLLALEKNESHANFWMEMIRRLDEDYKGFQMNKARRKNLVWFLIILIGFHGSSILSNKPAALLTPLKLLSKKKKDFR